MTSDDATTDGIHGITTTGNVLNRTKHKGLKVVIAGGGIGGLTAAIALRRQGHHVNVYEQSNFPNELGAAIHMTPNAMGVLKHIGIDPRDGGAVPLLQIRYLSANNDLLQVQKNDEEAARWQNPWMLAHRAHFHTQLKEATTSMGGEGEPVKIHTSSLVVSADPERATITLANDSSYSADVVIGADGVHSKTRAGVVTPSPETFKTPASAFQFIMERKVVLEDTETRDMADEMGSVNVWDNGDRKIVLYPTSDTTLLNFVCIHPGVLSNTTDSSDSSASKATLLEVYRDFHPRVQRLLSKAKEAAIRVYPIYEMKTLPTFAVGRLALVGDAAHPFDPYMAQGGAMAIEDGVSLGIMLDGTVTPVEIPERLQLYNRARYERSSTVQEYSRQVSGDGADSSGDANQSSASKLLLYKDYGLSHDEVHASSQLLRLHNWNKHTPGVRWRQPTVFGPLPGPRQDASGNSYRESLRDSTKTVVNIKFKTSATLLRNLFPNNRYFFETKDTVAKVSLTVDSLGNMAWLGGGGYDLFAVYVHGVCYKEADGRIRKGTYCPLMIENLADPISTGREELGIPKMFSDIEISKDSTSCRVNISWRGAQWASLEIKRLQGVEKDPYPIDRGEGLLVHKYIPSTVVGKPDADYDILHLSDSPPAIRSMLAARPEDVLLEFRDLGSKALPTLHPIVSRLAELPILGILGGTWTEVQGVGDFALNMHRLS